MTTSLPATVLPSARRTDPADWLLTAAERGNPATRIDSDRPPGAAWSTGGRVTIHVDGADYFARLHGTLSSTRAGDRVYLIGWRMNATVPLHGPGSELGALLARLAGRGVTVRGLLWRSYSLAYNEETNRRLSSKVNRVGGQVLTDQRIRRFGSHHQKFVVVSVAAAPAKDVAFLGGIDLSEGRLDTGRHLGDDHPLRFNPRYGPRPPWHDLQLEVVGSPVGDVEHTFRERWDDTTPRDHRNPVRAMWQRIGREPKRPDPLPAPVPRPPAGRQLVQVLRTYPARRPGIPFAPQGERSIARAYLKALRRARALVYIEDQFLWSRLVTAPLMEALRRERDLRMIVVLPRYPDHDGPFATRAALAARWAAIQDLLAAGGPRVAIYDLENEAGTPIYVHAKTMVVDDVWAVVGSANLNRRSWTYDSEIACAVLDTESDLRQPLDPGGRGDGARRFARDLRLQLWHEHLRGCDFSDPELLDPVQGFEAIRSAAKALDAWHRDGKRGPRPPGRLRPHAALPSRLFRARWIPPLCRLIIDPDGRPVRMRLSNEL